MFKSNSKTSNRQEFAKIAPISMFWTDSIATKTYTTNICVLFQKKFRGVVIDVVLFSSSPFLLLQLFSSPSTATNLSWKRYVRLAVPQRSLCDLDDLASASSPLSLSFPCCRLVAVVAIVATPVVIAIVNDVAVVRETL